MNEIDMRLIYEWNARRAKLDFAVAEAEHQLASVNKRLKSLWYDFAIYLAMCTVPWLLYRLLLMIPYIPAIWYVLLVIFRYVLLCVYVILLPFNLYYLAKTIALLKINNPKEPQFTPPMPEGSLRDTQPQREPNYRCEQQKLIFILSRYYLNQDIMDQMLRKIKSGTSSINLADMKLELDKLPFYESVRPADADASVGTSRRPRTRTTWLLVLSGAIILLRLMISFWI